MVAPEFQSRTWLGHWWQSRRAGWAPWARVVSEDCVQGPALDELTSSGGTKLRWRGRAEPGRETAVPAAFKCAELKNTGPGMVR